MRMSGQWRPTCGGSWCFFFSSRRRHTRCSRDWSSDVCSSDLSRLSVRYVAKKGKVLVGFHERKSRYIADMETCKILPPHVDAMLLPMRALIASMEDRKSVV